MDKWHNNLVYNFKLAWEKHMETKQIQEGGCLHLVLVAQRCNCKWLVSKDSFKVTSSHIGFRIQREFLQAHKKSEVRIQEGQTENKIWTQ